MKSSNFLAQLRFTLFSAPVLLGASSSASVEQIQPNILWLTVEDTSSYFFSCYGNKIIKTPTVDMLAKGGVKFTNASSVAPHCSPSRSTLISGCYATTYGMDFHRIKIETPGNIFYPAHFRKAGYYCTNNSKTHYNTRNFDMKVEWHESSKDATYASPDRKPGQPFFSVFNFGGTHMSRYRSMTIEGRRDLTKHGIDAQKIFLPPHIPDLPETRSDHAHMHERVMDCDTWVKAFIDDLKAKELYENTIIFFYSDHGGCLPRGKGYPFESGLRVPFIIHAPEKLRAKLGITPGSVDNRLFGFEDAAPTALSMAGIKPPEHMEGKAIFGQFKSKEHKQYQFGFRTNQEHNHFDPCRMVSDGRFKYIRNYIPHKPFAMRNFFQWGLPSNLAWDTHIMSGEANARVTTLPYRPKEPEMLFDLKNDPWETNNLVDDPDYHKKLLELRGAVSNHIRQTKDLGFFALGLRTKTRGLYHWVRDTNFPLDDLYDVVELASMPTLNDVNTLTVYLKSEHPEIRFWAAIGFCTLGAQGNLPDAPDEILQAIKDPIPEVSIIAADAACHLNRSDIGIPILIKHLKTKEGLALSYSSLESLTWYPERKEELKSIIPILMESCNQKVDIRQYKHAIPMKARSLLINLDSMPLEKLYTEEMQKAALHHNLTPPPFEYHSYLKAMEEKARINAEKRKKRRKRKQDISSRNKKK